jgi:hypothetical protein
VAPLAPRALRRREHCTVLQDDGKHGPVALAGVAEQAQPFFVQHLGMSSSIRLCGRSSTKRESEHVRLRCGLTLLSSQVSIKEAMLAQAPEVSLESVRQDGGG